MKLEELRQNGFLRVERDDRLLDVFTRETPDKGVELWEKWNDDTVEIVRLHNNQQTTHVFVRGEIEKALLDGDTLILT